MNLNPFSAPVRVVRVHDLYVSCRLSADRKSRLVVRVLGRFFRSSRVAAHET